MFREDKVPLLSANWLTDKHHKRYDYPLQNGLVDTRVLKQYERYDSVSGNHTL